MPTIPANGVQIHYEDRGDPAGPTVLLIMGLGTQMIAWPDAFVEMLTAAGHRVILYDNRDIGLSTHLHDAPVTNPLLAFAARRIGLPFRHGYALKDMAGDAVALLDDLAIPAAHVVGVSMGGM